MICFPNAKINLGLNVVRKRPDGYHDIETVFYPIPVKDALEVTAAGQDEFHLSGIPVDAPMEKNLVMKALNKLREFYTVPGLNVALLKAIPFGAEVGGDCRIDWGRLSVLHPQYSCFRFRHRECI